nr:uncharacterized protein LOC105870780 [Microcebus murinus]
MQVRITVISTAQTCFEDGVIHAQARDHFIHCKLGGSARSQQKSTDVATWSKTLVSAKYFPPQVLLGAQQVGALGQRDGRGLREAGCQSPAVTSAPRQGPRPGSSWHVLMTSFTLDKHWVCDPSIRSVLSHHLPAHGRGWFLSAGAIALWLTRLGAGVGPLVAHIRTPSQGGWAAFALTVPLSPAASPLLALRDWPEVLCQAEPLSCLL